MDHGALKLLLTLSAKHAMIFDDRFRIVAASVAAEKATYQTGGTLEEAFDLSAEDRMALTRCMRSTVKRKFSLTLQGGEKLMARGARLGKPFNDQKLVLLELAPLADELTKFRLKTQAVQIDRRARKYEYISSVLEQQNLHLFQKASVDGMTGLLNRATFDDMLKAQVASKSEFGLFYLDLNNLKRINDELGHEAGDEAIRTVARCIQDTIRRSDYAARLGGDEFAILATCMIDRSALRAFVTRLCGAISRAPENRKRPPHHRFSTAIGAAIWPQDSRSISSLCRMADQAMYVSKRNSIDVAFASDLDETKRDDALFAPPVPPGTPTH